MKHLVDVLITMRDSIGNEKIRNIVSTKILYSILQCLALRQSCKDVLQIKGFVPLLMNILKKALNFENPELLFVCLQIKQVILMSDFENKEDLKK